MRPFSFLPKLFLVVMTGLLSCERSPLSSGTGTETINTYAFLSDGTPAKGASVRIIDASGWIDSVGIGSSPVLQNVVADSLGRFTIAKTNAVKSINVQIDHAEQGLFIPFTTLSNLDDTLRLQTYASYAGSFRTDDQAPRQVLLSGTIYQTAIGPTNAFNFSKVAPGAYMILGVSGALPQLQVGTSGAMTLYPGVATVDTALNSSFDRLLIDNFENGVGPTALGNLIPSLNWYSVSNTDLILWNKTTRSWDTKPYPPGCSSTASLSPVSGTISSTAMEFSSTLDPNCSNPFSIAGISFGDYNKNGVDFSSMTGFSLTAHGKGVIWVRFETKTLDTATNGQSNYTYPIQLTDTVTNYFVPVDSLRILPAIQSPWQFPWSVVSKNLIDIEFEFSIKTNSGATPMQLIIDDFYVNGVHLDDFTRYQQ